MSARQAGFTYLGALFLVALMGAALAGAGHLWSTASVRAKERDLLWVGSQYAQALRRYYEATPGGAKLYPKSLADLVEDKRFPTPRRHLRRLYPDPFTGQADWGLILSEDGRIAGLHSVSERPVMKRARFPAQWGDFDGKLRYRDWEFVADRAFSGAPGAAQAKDGPQPPGAPNSPGKSPLQPAPFSPR